MKRILFIVALLPFLVKAQSINNQKIRWMQPIYMGSNTAATVNASSDTGAFFFDRADSVLYFKYKGAARAIGYAGSIPNVGQQITDSLKALVRIRASGSGGIQLQNSVGTNVADFGIANTTNGSIAGGWNVGGNSIISGTLGVTQKATFSDSIVGVNQRLSGTLNVGNGNMTNTSFSLRGDWVTGSSTMKVQPITSLSSGGISGIGYYDSDGTTREFYSAVTNSRVELWGMTNKPISIATNGTEKITITSAGDVGINRSTPLYRLDLDGNVRFANFGSGSTSLFINSLNTGTSTINFGGESNPTRGRIFYSDNSDALSLWTNSTERLTISSTGAATFSSSVTAGGDIVTPTRVATDLINGYTGGSTPLTIQTGGAQNLIFGTSGTERLRITSSGNVGIGTTSPSARLHIVGSVGGGGILRLTDAATESSIGFRINGNGDNTGWVAGNANNSFFVYSYTLGASPLTIASTGAATFSSSATVQGALTATAQGNNITVGVDSSVTTTSYTLVLGDAGYLKRCSNASAITITVPTNASVAFPIGTTIYFSQQGAGKVSVSPATSDVTIQSEGNLLGTAGQHAVIGLIKVNTNRWLLVGNRG